MTDRTFGIFLPGEFEDGSGLRRLNRPQAESVRLPADLGTGLGPMLFARTPIPSFSDHFHPYLTLAEIAKHLDEGGEFLFMPSTENVVEQVKALPFDPAMRWVALAQRLLVEVKRPGFRAGCFSWFSL